MTLVPVNQSSLTRMKAWLRIGFCLICYLAVLEVAVRWEVELGYGAARAGMGVFTAAMLVLALAYLAAFRRARWLPVTGYIVYFSLCEVTIRRGVTHQVTAQAILLVAAFLMLFAALVAVFNPLKRNTPMKQ